METFILSCQEVYYSFLVTVIYFSSNVLLQSFKDLVGTCLVKDPKKRPSSEKLLKHPFFKQARTVDYLAKTILEGMPPLGERFSDLKVLSLSLYSVLVLGCGGSDLVSRCMCCCVFLCAWGRYLCLCVFVWYLMTPTMVLVSGVVNHS